jgi:hypothetical protein
LLLYLSISDLTLSKIILSFKCVFLIFIISGFQYFLINLLLIAIILFNCD